MVFEPTLGMWLRELDTVFCQANYIREKTGDLYTLEYTPRFLPNSVKVPEANTKKATPQVLLLGRFYGDKKTERFFELCNHFPDVGFVAGGASRDLGRDVSVRRK